MALTTCDIGMEGGEWRTRSTRTHPPPPPLLLQLQCHVAPVRKKARRRRRSRNGMTRSFRLSSFSAHLKGSNSHHYHCFMARSAQFCSHFISSSSPPSLSKSASERAAGSIRESRRRRRGFHLFEVFEPGGWKEGRRRPQVAKCIYRRNRARTKGLFVPPDP